MEESEMVNLELETKEKSNLQESNKCLNVCLTVHIQSAQNGAMPNKTLFEKQWYLH